MTTVVLTPPPIPGGGTVDGSGLDTVEVISRPIIDPPTILSTVLMCDVTNISTSVTVRPVLA